jgi:hypothetical protein
MIDHRYGRSDLFDDRLCLLLTGKRTVNIDVFYQAHKWSLEPPFNLIKDLLQESLTAINEAGAPFNAGKDPGLGREGGVPKKVGFLK